MKIELVSSSAETTSTILQLGINVMSDVLYFFLILYSFQSVIHVTLDTSQNKYNSIYSLHTLTNLYSSTYLIQSLKVRSIYIVRHSVHYQSDKKKPNFKKHKIHSCLLLSLHYSIISSGHQSNLKLWMFLNRWLHSRLLIASINNQKTPVVCIY
jgi:hypothetical protein